MAVFSGPTATVLNTPPLVTSQRAAGGSSRGELLRAQRLAAPVTVYVEQFSAHPLERDAAGLYGPPDGYIDAHGKFRTERAAEDDVPAYRVELRPEDGLYLLPYLATMADGEPWRDDGVQPLADEDRCRQPFFPDASRLFEEIDRFGLASDGRNQVLSSLAEYDFHRVAPPAGYRRGLPGSSRTDAPAGDIQPEVAGEDFFPYRPRHLRREPGRKVLAEITNAVQRTLDEGGYDGALWLEGSPFIEETLYWLSLVLDADLPVVGVASPDWAHGVAGNVGDRNAIDAVHYVTSGAWRGDGRNDGVGAVLVNGGRILAAREAHKADARGVGYVTTGGLGGILGAISQAGQVTLEFRPTRRFMSGSEVCLNRVPEEVPGTAVAATGRPERVMTRVRDGDGALRAEVFPRVSIVKYGRYLADGSMADPSGEVEVMARIERNLHDAPLAGFIAEGGSPHGHLSGPLEAALERAVTSGMPVVKVGRGNVGGFVPGERVRLGSGRFAIAGNNATATKARMLLTACLLRFGGLPAARDPANPTPREREAITARLAEFQHVFDTH